MDLVPAVAVAQCGHELGCDNGGLGRGGSSSGGLHLADPIGKTSSTAELHGYKAHGAIRPFRRLAVKEVHKSDYVDML